jgi:TolB-like protein/tetratricopeptide (TPR) repeat protein
VVDGIDETVPKRTLFLSYARADRARVVPLADALIAAGFDLWWDALIEGGTAFAAMIEAKLDSADAVIVAWSATSVLSDWVRDEAGHGRDQKKLVPVLLDRIEPPLGFRQYHAIDLHEWKGNPKAPEIASILRGIDTVGMGLPSRPRAVAAPLRTRRTVLVASGAAFAATAAGLAAWRGGLLGNGSAIVTNSVAVLPFANLSGDPQQAYFSDGLSEEVRAALSRNPLLRVLAPTSAGHFRDHAGDTIAIAAQLGVAFLLEGSVRRAGDLLRIDAELIDGKTGFSRWADSFDRKMENIFAIQSEIAGTVTSALVAQVGLLPRLANQSKVVVGTKNVGAYESYLRGRELYGHITDESVARAALAQFDAAIAADPAFAAAHAARARAIWVIASQFSQASQFAQLYGDAVASARKAVALAPDLADAQSTLAYVLFQGRMDIRGALAPFERSRVLGAGDASILGRYALYCAAIGHADAAREAMARAMDIDPLNPLIFRAAGFVANSAHQFAAALPLLAKALSLDGTLLDAHAYTGDALFALGRTGEAREAYSADPHDLLRLTGLAIAERRLGNTAAAKTAMQTLISTIGDGATYQQAQVLAQWRDIEGAIGMLYRARLIGDIGLIYARNDPMLDPVRSDPRFARLLKDIGFG